MVIRNTVASLKNCTKIVSGTRILMAYLLVKPLGHYSPYGSYWIALSMISDGDENSDVEPYVDYVHRWSKQHIALKPRFLHLRAELARQNDHTEVLP